METTKKERKVITPEEKIAKLEKAIDRYEKLATKAKADLAKIKAKQREAEIADLANVLLNSGKSIEEIKALLG